MYIYEEAIYPLRIDTLNIDIDRHAHTRRFLYTAFLHSDSLVAWAVLTTTPPRLNKRSHMLQNVVSGPSAIGLSRESL